MDLHKNFTHNKGLSNEDIESVFGHFIKFNIRKSDFSQNSIREKWTLHKIQYEENRLSHNSISEK